METALFAKSNSNCALIVRHETDVTKRIRLLFKTKHHKMKAGSLFFRWTRDQLTDGPVLVHDPGVGDHWLAWISPSLSWFCRPEERRFGHPEHLSVWPVPVCRHGVEQAIQMAKSPAIMGWQCSGKLPSAEPLLLANSIFKFLLYIQIKVMLINRRDLRRFCSSNI